MYGCVRYAVNLFTIPNWNVRKPESARHVYFRRPLDASERQITSKHHQDVENSRADAEAGERDPQGLKDLPATDAALVSEFAQSVLHRARLPFDTRESFRRCAENARRLCGILPLRGHRLGVVLYVRAAKEGRRLSYDVVRRSRPDFQQVEQCEIPIAA